MSVSEFCQVSFAFYYGCKFVAGGMLTSMKNNTTIFMCPSSVGKLTCESIGSSDKSDGGDGSKTSHDNCC